jgi:hypothetical protein
MPMRLRSVRPATVLASVWLLAPVLPAPAAESAPAPAALTIPELHACGLALPQFCQALEEAAHAASPAGPTLRMRCLLTGTPAARADLASCEDLDIHLFDLPLDTALDLVCRVCALLWAQNGSEVVISDTPLAMGLAATATVELPDYLRADLKHYAAGRDLCSEVLSGFLLERCGLALPPGSVASVSHFRRRLAVSSDQAALRELQYAVDQLTPREDVVALDVHVLYLADSAVLAGLCRDAGEPDLRDADAVLTELTRGDRARRADPRSRQLARGRPHRGPDHHAHHPRLGRQGGPPRSHAGRLPGGPGWDPAADGARAAGGARWYGRGCGGPSTGARPRLFRRPGRPGRPH